MRIDTRKLHDEKEYPDKFSLERGDWDNFNFDEWLKTPQKTRLTSHHHLLILETKTLFANL